MTINTTEKPSQVSQGGFKLLGIRPLHGCGQKYRKNLEPGRFYQFYQDYIFEPDYDPTGKQKVSFRKNPHVKIPKDLYDIKREGRTDLKINVSAIVGKNGSGKSTLFDLLFGSIFIASMDHDILEFTPANYRKAIDKHERNKARINRKFDLERKEGEDKITNRYISDALNELFKEDDSLKSDFENYFKVIEEKDNIIKGINGDIRWVEDLIKEYEKLKSEFAVEVYFEIDNTVYRLNIHGIANKKSEISIVLDSDNKITDKDNVDFTSRKVLKNWKKISDYFFYSIAISYSHHGLNSRQIGNWINALFHKNDGYQTPIVINPMRTEGNIDINVENDLVHQRLLALLLEPISNENAPEESLRKIAENKIAEGLTLRFNEEKIEYYREQKIKSNIQVSDDFLNQLCLEYAGSNSLFDHFDQIVIGTKMYIENKLIRICEKYDRYKRFIIKEQFKGDAALIEMICDDHSHITFKLKQALNFLILGHYKITDQNKKYSDTIQNFSTYIENGKDAAKKLNRTPSTIELLPPSIFDINISFEDGSNFADLSSGEKQSIYSISSIIYHILNINSVKENGDSKQDEKLNLLKYQYLNVMFDEVELYFHPDLQRKFIYELRESLKKINSDHIKNIIGINILFATHSPFILSDIPVQNILMLELNKDDKKSRPIYHSNQTFGANIYDLLRNDFFLKDGFLGEFAKEKINILINLINEDNNKLDYTQIMDIQKMISLIGEPIVKHKLNKLLEEKFPNHIHSDVDLDRKIELQEEFLRQLRAQKDRNEDNK